jgi:Flp pilus assembly protein CpaB
LAQLNPTGLTSRRPFTLLGIVLALIVIAAFVLVAFNATGGPAPGSMTVVVATQDLAPRVPIDAGSLELKRISVSGFSTDRFFTRLEDVKGTVPLVTIFQGQPVVANLIAKPDAALGSQSAYLPIPSGFVALTLPTSEQQGVAGYIQPNDYISIIATVSINGRVAAKTIYTNLHVIRVGSLQVTQGAASGQQAGSTTSLTLVVTQCQAEYITWFLTYAALKYTLESYQDYVPSGTAKDPSCPSVDAAGGVTLKDVESRYPTLF